MELSRQLLSHAHMIETDGTLAKMAAETHFLVHSLAVFS